ncbi:MULTISPECIES: AAA family ATPase [unclassified Bradyrhizobium]|uniref:AAA family ATPase n=1 Tax=unclassified Bradyrhizobium TaxID=2631580 RepID=UPI003517D7C8
MSSFDQRSANEGFLFLTFYLALFTSKLTPSFFAVDNVDASLNPKLCEALMRRLVELAKEHEKQVILTTHNPALLDGLNLGDREQRLFIVSRSPNGQTRVRFFETKPSSAKPRRLSELFLSGVLGGLPKGF